MPLRYNFGSDRHCMMPTEWIIVFILKALNTTCTVLVYRYINLARIYLYRYLLAITTCMSDLMCPKPDSWSSSSPALSLLCHQKGPALPIPPPSQLMAITSLQLLKSKTLGLYWSLNRYFGFVFKMRQRTFSFTDGKVIPEVEKMTVQDKGGGIPQTMSLSWWAKMWHSRGR